MCVLIRLVFSQCECWYTAPVCAQFHGRLGHSCVHKAQQSVKSSKIPICYTLIIWKAPALNIWATSCSVYATLAPLNLPLYNFDYLPLLGTRVTPQGVERLERFIRDFAHMNGLYPYSVTAPFFKSWVISPSKIMYKPINKAAALYGPAQLLSNHIVIPAMHICNFLYSQYILLFTSVFSSTTSDHFSITDRWYHEYCDVSFCTDKPEPSSS